MFARILIIAAHTPDETDWHARLARACAARGHAVRVWCPPDDQADNAFFAVRRAFRPTLALWTAEAWKSHSEKLAAQVADACASGIVALRPTSDALEAQSADFVLAVGDACLHALEEAARTSGRRAPFVMGMPAAIDAEYMQATLSDPNAQRDAVSFDQARTPEREAAAAALRDAACALETVAFHPSWPENFERMHPGANRTYRRRTTAFFAGLPGNDAPTEADIALRVAEGACVVIAHDDGESREGDAPFRAAVCEGIDGLIRTIASLACDDEQAQNLRERQHAALASMPALEDVVDETLAALDRECATRNGAPCRPDVLSQEQPAMKVVMYGWFGARNFGDDLLLASTATRIEQRYPQAFFCVIGANASVIENEYGYQAATPDRKYEVRAFLDQAAAMVLCGGLLFDDPLAQTAGEMEFCLDPWIEPTGQAAVCLLARSLGVPSVYLGFGAGPIDNRPTRIAVNLIARSEARFLPRDEHTKDLLEACGVKSNQIAVRADLILGARDYVIERAAQAPNDADGDFFTVSLRRWHRNPADFARQIAHALDAVTQETGLVALMLPFDQDDVELHRNVVEHMEHPESARVIETRPEETELLSLIARSRFAFAMRLHCSILHHILDKPAVGLNYNDKIEAHFRRFGQADMLLELCASSSEMTRLMEKAASWNEEDRNRLAHDRRDADRLVAEAFDELFAAIEHPLARPDGDPVFFPRRVSNVECLLREELAHAARRAEEAAARIELLESENAALRDEAAALRTSRSYRLGNAFMRIPHAVAARLGKR